jgi:hypothetical protein
MRQCELERVERKKGIPNLVRTGEKLIAFIEGVTPDMETAIIDLKKKEGFWVIDKIHGQDVERHEIKRNWKVGGL